MSMHTVPTSNTTSKQAMANLQHVEELAAHMGAIFVPTSAKNNENVTDLFSQVAERVLQFQKKNKYSAAPNNIPVTLGSSGGGMNDHGRHHHGQSKSVPTSPSTSPRMAHFPYSSNALPNLAMGIGGGGGQQQESHPSRPTSPLHTQQPPSDNAHHSPLSNPYNNSINPDDPYRDNGNYMNREDYLHRRMHTPSPTNNNNNNNNNPSSFHNYNHNVVEGGRGQPLSTDSPTRFLPKTSAMGMDSSPNSVSNLPPSDNNDTPKLTAASTMCGDTDYLTCAGMPYGSGPGGVGGSCVIL